jgi:hypothetical protein
MPAHRLGAVFFAGLMGVSFLGAIGILAMQLLWWLKEGEWPSLTARELLAYNNLPGIELSWRGAQKIADWLLDLPLATDPLFRPAGVTLPLCHFFANINS